MRVDEALVGHAVRAVLPPGGDWPADVEVGPFVGRTLRECSGLMWLGLVGAALAFWLSPVLTLGWPVPSSWLGAEALDRHADRVTRSPIYGLRSAMVLLKMMAGYAWGERAEVRARLGLDAPTVDPRSWRDA